MSINPGSRIACVLVGLPGTSKSLVAQKVCRYLQWLGINSKVFSVGNYRRKQFGSNQPYLFFDPTNPEGERSRAEAANEALKDMIAWFQTDQQQDNQGTTSAAAFVGIYDATNTTRARRNFLLQEFQQHNVQVMFIESVCEDEGIRLANMMEMQRTSPDYAELDPETAIQDFKARIGHFKGSYETITEKNLTFIKLIDAGSEVIISQIHGYLQSRVVYYLMNLKITPRKIYFSRHGESLYNVMGFLGGDSDLSARGKQYARALPSLVATHIPNHDRLTVWTSTKKRTIATAKHLPNPKVAWKALDELEAGKADGLTYEQVEERFPEDFAKRDSDKYIYRYQDGESYQDVVARLEPVIMDLERQDDILIIGHQAILRCLYAYFMNYPTERLPYLKIPLHTLIQITPGAYSCEEKRFKVDIEAVDTHRPKPKAGAGNANGVNNDNNTVTEHQDDPFHKAAAITAVAPPSPPTSVKPSSVENEKTLQSEAASDTPRIIQSSLITNTFRDSIYTSADSFSSSTKASAASVVVTATSTTTSTKQEAPSSIDLPSPSEKTKLIAEALLQANNATVKSSAVTMNLDGIVTPLPEQETGGVKGPILGLDTNNDNSSNNASVRSALIDTVTTPPLSPISQESRSDSSSSSSSSDVSAGDKIKTDSFQLPTNPQTLAATCV